MKLSKLADSAEDVVVLLGSPQDNCLHAGLVWFDRGVTGKTRTLEHPSGCLFKIQLPEIAIDREVDTIHLDVILHYSHE